MALRRKVKKYSFPNLAPFAPWRESYLLTNSRKENTMQVQPYFFFSGNCEEALEFYKKALGAEVQMMVRYKESPEPPPADKVPANWGDKIMHANVRIGETQVMASDCDPQEGAAFKNFSLTISSGNEGDTDRLFNALANGVQVQMPL